jgi:hypothetical protein
MQKIMSFQFRVPNPKRESGVFPDLGNSVPVSQRANRAREEMHREETAEHPVPELGSCRHRSHTRPCRRGRSAFVPAECAQLPPTHPARNGTIGRNKEYFHRGLAATID